MLISDIIFIEENISHDHVMLAHPQGGRDEEEGGSRGAGATRLEATTPDSHLSPDARLMLYENQGWRMEVRGGRGEGRRRWGVGGGGDPLRVNTLSHIIIQMSQCDKCTYMYIT